MFMFRAHLCSLIMMVASLVEELIKVFYMSTVVVFDDLKFTSTD